MSQVTWAHFLCNETCKRTWSDLSSKSTPTSRHYAITVQLAALQTIHSVLTKNLFGNIFSWTASVRRRKKVPNKKCDFLKWSTQRVVGCYQSLCPYRQVQACAWQCVPNPARTSSSRSPMKKAQHDPLKFELCGICEYGTINCKTGTLPRHNYQF